MRPMKLEPGWENIVLHAEMDRYPIEAKLRPKYDDRTLGRTLDLDLVKAIEAVARCFKKSDARAWRLYIYSQFEIPVRARYRVGVTAHWYDEVYAEGRAIARWIVSEPGRLRRMIETAEPEKFARACVSSIDAPRPSRGGGRPRKRAAD
jgi:hypothetical protein